MILDADVLVDLWRQHPSAVAWFSGLTEPPPAAGLTALELLEGCQNLAERRGAVRLLRPFPLVWPSESAMLMALWDVSILRLSHGLGMIDSLIAVTAIENDEPLATFNMRHFAAVPRLTTVQPYSRP